MKKSQKSGETPSFSGTSSIPKSKCFLGTWSIIPQLVKKKRLLSHSVGSQQRSPIPPGLRSLGPRWWFWLVQSQQIHILVGGLPTPLKNMKVSWDDFPFPIWWESHKIHVPNHQPVYTIHVKIFKYQNSGPATRDVHEWLSVFCWIIWMWSQNLCQVSEVVRERTRYPMVHIHHQQKELTTSVVNLPITSSWRTGKSRQPAVFLSQKKLLECLGKDL